LGAQADARGDHPAATAAVVQARRQDQRAHAAFAVVVRRLQQRGGLPGVHRRVVEVELGHRGILRQRAPRGRGPWPPGASVPDRTRPAGPPQRVEWPARSIRPAALNPQQRAAVPPDQGPLLVLAGAGSGKTRVIVEKIAHLIATGRYPARRIAAITFTNKSAKEMRERVAKRIRGDAADGLTICTFHALGLKFL